MSAPVEPPKTRRGKSSGASRLSAARLAAVQALYQIELSGDPMEDVLFQFLTRPGGQIDAPEGQDAVEPKSELLTEIVRGVHGRVGELDEMLGAALVEGWPIGRIEQVLRCILRAGAYELAHRRDTPLRVVIHEYVDLAHAFYGGPEPGMVNGVLDKLARELRPKEMAGGGAGTDSNGRSSSPG